MDLPTGPEALLTDIYLRLHEEPLRSRWARRRELPEVLRNVVLLVDLTIELAMNGLTGLVENSLGEFLPEIVAALDAVGAREGGDVLRSVQAVMARHGITHAMLRGDNAHGVGHEVVSFGRAHGEAASAMMDELHATVSPRLRLNDPDGENLGQLLKEYVSLHQRAFEDEVAETLRAKG